MKRNGRSWRLADQPNLHRHMQCTFSSLPFSFLCMWTHILFSSLLYDMWGPHVSSLFLPKSGNARTQSPTPRSCAQARARMPPRRLNRPAVPHAQQETVAPSLMAINGVDAGCFFSLPGALSPSLSSSINWIAAPKSSPTPNSPSLSLSLLSP